MTAVGAESEVVSIGVTGHRFLRDKSVLCAGLIEAMDMIKSAFPGRVFNVISPLAEGADRLVADLILKYPGAKLIVPLPLSKSEYMLDFAAGDSRAEFMRMLDLADEVIQLPPTRCRNAACEALGLYVLEHCDFLIALWDGAATRGRGGTAEIIALALEIGKPVCHIWAGNNSPDLKKRTEVGNMHGRLRCFNFPGE